MNSFRTFLVSLSFSTDQFESYYGEIVKPQTATPVTEKAKLEAEPAPKRPQPVTTTHYVAR